MSGAGERSPAPGPATPPFGDRLAAAVAARESQIVLGIDPDPSRLWPEALVRTSEARANLAQAVSAAHEAARAVLEAATPPPGGNGWPARAGAEPPRPPALEAAAAVLAHCLALIEAAGPACVAAKPQLACFERLGFAGALALEAVCEAARAAGLLVLADGKRGDVPVTAAAYAQALTGRTPSPFGGVPGLGVDAFTANPLLGRDALEPLVAGARAAGAGVFVLVRTSNPGAADLLDLPLAGGEPLWERLTTLVNDLGRPSAAGLADVGAVTGATAPEHLARMRELMPSAPFLLPGVGAQGGDVGALAPAFAPGRAGGLVTASRSIADAHEASDGERAAAARAEAERLRDAAWNLV
ncbi:MAG TPA: orotidine-5'-phosphate decarboxylase [Solirubrobacteraceae bacterium]|nr:orotidine-5'-phosphate decarboxylase [Solirubrobacteraceae bacterium]